MAEVTWEEFHKQPEILEGLVSDVQAPVHFFTEWLGLRYDSAPRRIITDGRVNWDVYNASRGMAVGRHPRDGFATKTPKAYESRNASIARLAQKTEFYDNDYLNMRPAGKPWTGVITNDIQNWISREIMTHKREFSNAWDFMLVRLFQGGFGMDFDVNTREWLLCEKGAGDHDVDPGIPAGNLGQLDLLGAGGADAIDVPWDNPAADLIAQFDRIDAYTSLLGMPQIRNVFMPPGMAPWLFDNTKFKAVAGTSNRVYQTWEEEFGSDATTGTSRLKQSFYVFTGLPHVKFWSIYDPGYILGQKDRQTTTYETTASNITRMIPPTKVMMLPDREYLREVTMKIDGSEYVSTDNIGGKRLVSGFTSFQHPLTGDQPGWVLKMIYHGLPILQVPRFALFPTVDF